MNSTPGNEPGEDLNVRRIHGQIWREKAEPTERYRRIPWWLKHMVYAPLSIWAVIYLFSMSGGFRWDNYMEELGTQRITPEVVAALTDAPSEVIAKPKDPTAAGRTVYARVCTACHQVDGAGLAGAFPPLAGSDWVAGDDRRLTLLVLHGLTGPIQVNGVTWNGAMPAQGAALDDQQVADVLTYIRASWGNNAPPVDVATVSELRKAHEGSPPWTTETLNSTLSEP